MLTFAHKNEHRVKLLFAAATVLGRFRLGDKQALSSRYLTPGAVLWSVPEIAAAVELNACLRLRARIFGTVCMACAAAAVGISDEMLGAEVMTSQMAGMPLAFDAYVVGVKDGAALDAATTTSRSPGRCGPF